MKNSTPTQRFLTDDRGTGMVEYSVLLAFVMFIVLGLAHGFHNCVSGVTALTNSNFTSAKDVLH
jgi:Flp pilus assembly pilin Flp